MNEKIIGFNTTSSSVYFRELNSDFHFATEKIRDLTTLGNPERFMTSPTEIKKEKYRKAASYIRSWLNEDSSSDTLHYDQLQDALAKDKVKMRKG